MKIKLVDLITDKVIEIPDIVKITIGRSHEADISLDGYIDEKETLKYLSRTHCMIDSQNDPPYVTDLDSVNGTYVNGEKVESTQGLSLVHGDILRLDQRGFQVLFENNKARRSEKTKKMAQNETVTMKVGRN